MSTSKPNTKIINGKVAFSNEVLNYINKWRTNENSKYIDEYMKVLLNPSNIIATKFEIHHIIPAFTFRDGNHKNRKETIKLADKVTENKIKLSLKYHKLAHYYLWKIFPNDNNARNAVYFMFNNNDIEDLTKDEVIKFARILEECAKENLTEEEKRERDKKRRNTEKYKKSKREYDKNRHKANKEKKCKHAKIYGQTHKKEGSVRKKVAFYFNI